MRIIAVASGKGGVGKTTLSANLAVTLRTLGKRVVIIDCNLTTSHLGLLFGINSYPVSFNDFLKGKLGLNDVLYTHYSGLHIIPASLNLEDMTGITAKPDYLKQTMRGVFATYDFVILDSAPGVGNEALLALLAADEVLFVSTPTIPALVDVVKTKDFLTRLHRRRSAIGIVVNRVKGKNHEMSADEIRHFTDLPVVGVVPEDENVIKSENRRELIATSSPGSPASRAIYRIATRMAGVTNPIYVPDDLYDGKRGFLRRLFDGLKRTRR